MNPRVNSNLNIYWPLVNGRVALILMFSLSREVLHFQFEHRDRGMGDQLSFFDPSLVTWAYKLFVEAA